MAISTTAKTQFKIGTTTPFATATAYAADTWVNIGNIQDMGEAGSEAEIVVGKFVDQTYARKLKGSRDNGTIELVVARDSSDPGYLALMAAEKTSFGYNFQIELNDKPATGASPKNSKFYFNALIASAKNGFGGADDITTTTFSLAVSGEIIETPASAT